MSAANIDICNRALYLVGSNRIESLAENSHEARSCNLFYDEVINYLLERYQWSFNKKIFFSSFSAKDFPNKGKWEYAHSLPANCGHILSVYDMKYIHGDCPIEFEVLLGSIMTNAPKVKILYSENITELTIFPFLFQDCIVKTLASRINRDENKIKYFRELSEAAIALAIARDGDNSGVDWRKNIPNEVIYGYPT